MIPKIPCSWRMELQKKMEAYIKTIASQARPWDEGFIEIVEFSCVLNFQLSERQSGLDWENLADPEPLVPQESFRLFKHHLLESVNKEKDKQSVNKAADQGVHNLQNETKKVLSFENLEADHLMRIPQIICCAPLLKSKLKGSMYATVKIYANSRGQLESTLDTFLSLEDVKGRVLLDEKKLMLRAVHQSPLVQESIQIGYRHFCQKVQQINAYVRWYVSPHKTPDDTHFNKRHIRDYIQMQIGELLPIIDRIVGPYVLVPVGRLEMDEKAFREIQSELLEGQIQKEALINTSKTSVSPKVL